MISFHMVGNTGAVVETGQGTRPSIGTRFAWYPLLRGARHAARSVYGRPLAVAREGLTVLDSSR